MTAGAVGYSRRRFMGLTAIAAVTWGCYSALIGIGAGAWLHDHTLVAVAVGVVGGLAIGLVIDWVLRKLTHHRPAVAGERPGAPGGRRVRRAGRAAAAGERSGHRTLTIRPRRLTIRYHRVISPMTVLTL